MTIHFYEISSTLGLTQENIFKDVRSLFWVDSNFEALENIVFIIMFGNKNNFMIKIYMQSRILKNFRSLR